MADKITVRTGIEIFAARMTVNELLGCYEAAVIMAHDNQLDINVQALGVTLKEIYRNEIERRINHGN